MLAATGALSLAVLGLLPYFGYLFGFFSPGNVIGRVQRQAERAIRRTARSGAWVDRRRERVIGNVEHLADMILIAIKNDESALAVPAIEALSELARVPARAQAGSSRRSGSRSSSWPRRIAISSRWIPI